MAIALAALGSNLGDRAATLQAAVNRLQQSSEIEVLAVSRWHETQPVGGPSGQQSFLNGAVLLKTTLPPHALWRVFQQLEQAADRQRAVYWGPRTLDVDLLLYDQQVLATSELIVPHPRMMYRRFVMEPAAEIAAHLMHPLLGWQLGELRDHLIGARNYIALCAPPDVSTSQLAEQLHQAIPSQLLSDHIDRGEFPANNATPAALLTTLKRQSRRLDRTRWGDSGRASDELLVSDFWLGEATFEAATSLTTADAALVHHAWEESRQDVIHPKLVVCLCRLKDGTKEYSPLKQGALVIPPASPSCGDRPNCEQLTEWQIAAIEFFANGFGGPWLMIDITDPAAALQEIIAAALAMR